jgi:hypothetical protein
MVVVDMVMVSRVVVDTEEELSTCSKPKKLPS